MPNVKPATGKLFVKPVFTTEHTLAWACVFLAGIIVVTAPWWWQKIVAVPCASLVAAMSIFSSREAQGYQRLLARLESMSARFANREETVPGLVPYLDPVRASCRTGQIVYQFIRPIEEKGEIFMTTTLEQLIASFLQVGLAKIDTKLSPTTQQLIDTAVPTLVTTIASVIVDLAENHKSAKTTATTK